MLTVRELASGIVSLPSGVLVDMCRRYWDVLLSLSLGVLGLGSRMIGLAPVYPLLLVGMAVVAMTHSLRWPGLEEDTEVFGQDDVGVQHNNAPGNFPLPLNLA